MDRVTIRDAHSRVVGYIETDSHGNCTPRDAHMRLLGRYNAQRDVTHDQHSQLLGSGNQLSALVARVAT
ncbi:hypothetical protein [Paracidovorax citrulli]